MDRCHCRRLRPHHPGLNILLLAIALRLFFCLHQFLGALLFLYQLQLQNEPLHLPLVLFHPFQPLQSLFLLKKISSPTQSLKMTKYMCAVNLTLNFRLFFFSVNLSARCYFCGNPYQPDSLFFQKQDHAASVKVFCSCGDSLLWLSSPILGGTSQKYYVNLR